MAGKTLLGKKIMDDWLMQHPGKKALILDTKAGKGEIRYFVPNLLLQEKVKNGR